MLDTNYIQQIDAWAIAHPNTAYAISWIIFLIFWNSFTKLLFRLR